MTTGNISATTLCCELANHSIVSNTNTAVRCFLLYTHRYASSYDWSQGVEHANPQATNIMVHTVADDEIKPRPKDKK